MALFTQAPRKVRASRAWARQTARVAFPVTITKPNGETFTVAPSRKQVAKRKSNAKHTPKRVAKLPATITAQDTRAITLEERRKAFAESQRKIEREMLGQYN